MTRPCPAAVEPRAGSPAPASRRPRRPHTLAALAALSILITACDGEETSYKPPTTGSSTGTSTGGGGAGATGGGGGAGAAGGNGGTGGEGATGGTGGATLCGNGVIDPGEACDGDAVGDATCEKLGYPGGAIGCDAACALDTSRCSGADNCTDGVDNDADGFTDCQEADCQAACADACAAPVPLVDPDDTSGSTAGHADTVQSSCGGASGADVVYAVTAAVTGVLDVVLIEDGSASFSLSARTDCASAASELACTAAFAGAGDLTKKLSLPVTAGQLVFVAVDGQGAGAEGTYTLAVQSHVIDCGDGLQDPPEACDDGNTDAGDGCGPTCTLEAMEPEPNDTVATAAAYADPYYASIDPEGDVDLVKVDLPASGGLIVSVLGLGDFACTDGSMDSLVTILDGAGAPIATNDDTPATGLCSALAVAGLPAGTYHVKVEASPMASPAAATFPYRLQIATSECGDGVVSQGEECEGDVTMGAPEALYSCTAACTFASGETEDNGTPATADVYTSPKWIGRIDPDGDVDVVSVNVPGPASKLTAKTYGPDGSACWPGADTYVEILAPNGTVIAMNDDAGSYCSLATATNLAAGTYAVRVKAQPTLDVGNVYVFPYALGITVE